jgi:hypothetical protein
MGGVILSHHTFVPDSLSLSTSVRIWFLFYFPVLLYPRHQTGLSLSILTPETATPTHKKRKRERIIFLRRKEKKRIKKK